MGLFYVDENPTTFELAGRQFPRVSWYSNARLRKLYICLLFVVLTSVSVQILVPCGRNLENRN